MTEKKLKIILPAVILVVAIVVTLGMLKSRAPVGTRPPQDFSPLVRVVEATPVNHQFSVWTHGTVKPRTEAALVSEVAGRVLSVAPSFADGGFFEKGDILVTVDPRDYELAVVTARGQVAQAKVRAAAVCGTPEAGSVLGLASDTRAGFAIGGCEVFSPRSYFTIQRYRT